MMLWRPVLLPVAAAAAAAAAASAGGVRHHAAGSICCCAAPAVTRRLLFVRPPAVRALGTAGGAAGSSDKGTKRRRRGPKSTDEAATACEAAPRPSFPPGLPTVERMRLLRAQARASEEEEPPQQQRPPDPGHEEEAATILAWLQKVVIGLKLCPWAASALNAGAIRIRIHPDGDLGALTQTVLEEAAALAAMPETSGGRNATVLIGVPRALQSFEDEFLEYAAVVDDLIDELGLRGRVQLASFHPDYTFADSTPEADVENFTNRSPMPVLHLLRECEVSRALAQYPGEPDTIYERNKAVMRSMGKRQLQALIDACRAPGAGSA